MDRSAVKRIVEREIGPLQRRLGLDHWKIAVSYDLREGGDGCRSEATCSILVDYDRARIDLDPDCLDDEAAVLRVLRHELFHLVLAPFNVVVNALRPSLEKAPDLMAAMESIRAHADERAAINLERMWQGLAGDDDAKAPTPTRKVKPSLRTKGKRET